MAEAAKGNSRPIHVTIPVTVPVDVKPSDVPVIAKSDQPESMIRATQRMATMSVVMVFVAVAALVAAYLQWQATYGQIVQMKADYDAAQAQANAVLAQMKTDNGVMVDQLKSAKDQIELTKSQLEQNEKVLDQMRLEQRAWVSVRNPHFIEPTLGQPLGWKMELLNSGQTPALVKHVEFNLTRRPRDGDFDAYTVPLKGVLNLDLSLAPSAAPFGFPFITTNNVVDRALLEFIGDKSASDAVYIVGRVLYEDVAGVTRETEFTFAIAGSLELRFHNGRNRMK